MCVRVCVCVCCVCVVCVCVCVCVFVCVCVCVCVFVERELIDNDDNYCDLCTDHSQQTAIGISVYDKPLSGV